MPPRHLDATDIVLVQMLLSNSRATPREMADFLSTTPEEVERRVRSMVEIGVLRSFVARLRPSYLGAVGVLVYGTSDVTSLEKGIERLEKSECTSWVGVGSGGRLYAGALLRRLSHLDRYISFLRQDAGMQDPVFGIRSPPPDVKAERIRLDEVDYRILASLRQDARKSTFEVSQELGLERSEIDARVKAMVDGEAVEFSVVLSPETTSDVLCMFHLHHRAQAPLREFMRSQLNEHSPNVLFFNTFRNLPDLMMALAWTNDMAELREIKASMEGEPAVDRVEANVLIGSRAVATWADMLIDEKAR